jgi:membrane protein YqaA with SNARE-associated domain
MQQTLLALGGTGLALAFAVESFVVFPGGTDALLFAMSVARPEHAWYYVLMSAGGSIAGSLLLFEIARRGGEPFVERHVKTARGKRALAALRRYEVFAVFVPSILPPPAPFKVFVILAGATGIGRGAFLAAMTAGRLLRYSVEVWLAVTYGNQALTFMRQHAARTSLAIAAVVVAAGVVVILRRMKRRSA